MLARGALKACWIAGGLALAGGSAQAMPESCQKEFTPLMEKRQAYLNQVNGFKDKKPTAPAACSAFSGLSASNKKLATWLESQKDWCQIPDEMLGGVKDQQGQIEKIRSQACNAAAKMSQMKNRAQQMQRQQAGPAVGGGVRLPQGAL